MATHIQIAMVIEKENPRGAIFRVRLAQQCSNHGFISARLQDYGAAKVVVVRAKFFPAIGKGRGFEFGTAGDHNSRWFAFGM